MGVVFPMSFSHVALVFGSIRWNWTQAWYADSANVKASNMTDVTGTPYDVTLAGFGIQSYSGHYYMAIGY